MVKKIVCNRCTHRHYEFQPCKVAKAERKRQRQRRAELSTKDWATSDYHELHNPARHPTRAEIMAGITKAKLPSDGRAGVLRWAHIRVKD